MKLKVYEKRFTLFLKHLKLKNQYLLKNNGSRHIPLYHLLICNFQESLNRHPYHNLRPYQWGIGVDDIYWHVTTIYDSYCSGVAIHNPYCVISSIPYFTMLHGAGLAISASQFQYSCKPQVVNHRSLSKILLQDMALWPYDKISN